MEGFLGFIAQQYGRKSEDVATDVVVYLLQRPDAKEALRQLLVDLGYLHVPPSFSATPREGGDNGIPDIRLVDDDGSEKCWAIIENKFWSSLTKKQPCAYLDEVKPNGIVLFVVPKPRPQGIWRLIQDRCIASEPIIECKATADCCIGRRGSNHVAVITWDRLIRAFQNLEGPDFPIFTGQLRRLVNVEEKTAVEYLKADVVGNKDAGKTIHGCMNLVQQLIDVAIDREWFAPDPPKKRVKENEHSCFKGNFGQCGEMGKFKAWIGFDSRLWSAKGESPIWIEFSEEKAKLWDVFLAARGKMSWLDDPERLKDGDGDESQLVISIPLEPGVDYDKLLQGAVKRIEEVATLLK